MSVSVDQCLFEFAKSELKSKIRDPLFQEGSNPKSKP